MFDPCNIDEILHLEAQDLVDLPSFEDELHEYKSSATKDQELKEKIARAASGFWNSGGGLFVIGVGKDSGRPDGGITNQVGRQTRRDWVDQAIAQTTPPSRYNVRCIEAGDSGLDIAKDHSVVLIGFAASEHGPHMAPDHRYYIRAGAHTVPAKHFLVESLWARRSFIKPRVTHLLQLEPYTGTTSLLRVELVTVTNSPALDVTIDLIPKTRDTISFPVRTSLIDASHSFEFQTEIPHRFQGQLIVTFRDLAGTQYNYEPTIDSIHCINSWSRGFQHSQQIVQALIDIKNSLERRVR